MPGNWFDIDWEFSLEKYPYKMHRFQGYQNFGQRLSLWCHDWMKNSINCGHGKRPKIYRWKKEMESAE